MKARTFWRAVALAFLVSVNGLAVLRYVNVNNPTPSPPYTSWATAATAIQDAINASSDGDEIWVTNGIYAVGSTPTPAFTLQCRVVLNKAVSVRSVNGPEATVIVGSGPIGWGAVRCAYLTNGALLAGFTLSNGYAELYGNYSFDLSGAGALLHAGGVLSNCVIVNNVAQGDSWRGGAVHCYWGGEVVDCVIERNTATNGAGGGVNVWYGGTVRSSRIVNNRAHVSSGGGIYCYGGGVVVDTLVSNNVAATLAGGISIVYTGTVDRCVVAGNVALTNSGGGIAAQSGGMVMNSVIEGNIAFAPDQYSGGGGVALGSDGVISNCVIRGNRCTGVGGGLRLLSGARAVNCAIYNNYAQRRGGGVEVFGALLLNCSVFNNRAGGSGGGAYFSNTSLAGNSIIYHNRAPLFENAEFINTTYQPPTNVNCCIYPAPPAYAVTFNAITNDPVLLGMSNPHIATNSPCVNAGTNALALGVDIDYEPRIVDGTVDIGCDEVVPAGLTGALAAAIYAPYTVAVVNVAASFYADVQSKAAQLEWQIETTGGVRVVNNAGMVQQAWPVPGAFPVILRAWNNEGMAAATVMVQVVSAVTNYVAHGGAHVAPFISLAEAATSNVAALEAVPPGGVTVVSNGVYAENATITLDKQVTLTSLAGRDETVLDGRGARRCVLMMHPAAVIQALTISNGFLNTEYGAGVYAIAGTVDRCALVNNKAYAGSAAYLLPGAVITGSYVRANIATRDYNTAGAIYCDGGGLVLASTIISNISTASSGDGGGLVFNYGGTAAYCVIAGNRADDGAGAYCYYGGELLNCVITGNFSTASTSSAGGGVYGYAGGVLRNCVIMNNRANGNGGGVRHLSGGRLANCTIMNNQALGNGGGYYSSGFVMENCIVYYNRAAAYPDYYHTSTNYARRYSCVTPLLAEDVQCFDASPVVAGVNNPHLMAASPCLNAGSNDAAAGIVVDVDNEPRIHNAIVDVGCDEYHPAGITGVLSAAILTDYTNAVMGAPLQFRADVRGKAQGLVWRIASGSGDAVFSNQTATSYAWSAPGNFDVVLYAWNATHSAAATVTVTMVSGFTNYVNYANTAPAAPYTSWATAATNIVDALAAAAAGGVMLVSTGVYREPATITVNMPLRLESVGGPAQVVINGAGTRRGLLTGSGGGVFITGFTFSNCAASDGAGIYCNAGDIVSNCVFVRNVASGAGGGLFGMVAVQIVDCVFYTNSAANGGGAYVMGGTVLRGAFMNNLASFSSGYGGGAYLNGGRMLECSFSTNLARYGGGAYLYYANEVRDTWFVGNIATATSATTIEGGGLNSMSTPVISNCHFLYNLAAREDCYGGGAYVRYATLYDCSFTANRANYGGGADLFSCTAWRATGVSNRMTSANWNARGAGLRLRGSTLRDSALYDNNVTAGAGGGVAAHQNSIVTNCVITRNRAEQWNSGAGVFADGNAVVVACQIYDNRAQNAGAGARLSGAVLHQCTIVSNYCAGSAGGVLLENNGWAELCRISANIAGTDGGGVLVWGAGRVLNCYIADNVATNQGGGVYMDDWTLNGVIEHCTIVNNTGIERGGGVCMVEGGLVRNGIVTDNLAGRDSNISLGSGTYAEYCCSVPAPPGPGNFNAAPLLAGAGNPHLLPGSPCIDAGTNTGLAAIDIDLEPRPNGARVDVGCDELWSSGLTGALAVAIDAPFSNVVINAAVPFNAIVQGKPHTLVWQFHTDGGVDLVSNLWSVSYAWSATGTFPVICSVFNNDSSASATTMVYVTLPVTNYVSPLGAHQYPFDSWAKAATQIIAAVEAAAAGGCVLVSNGTYVAPQGVLIWEKPVTITSLAGWQETIVDGQNARRGFIVLDTEALIEGFTIVNGFAPDDVFGGAGAGVILYKRGTVRNCVFLNNRALLYGGGVMCMEGGRVENCFFSGNQAQFGGGVLCFGGGTVVNCTMQRNRALIQGGGVFCQDGGTVQNSIMYHNLAGIGPNFWNQGSGMVYAACCTWPHPGDAASFTNAPMLAGIANPHLLTNSPCVNAGSNAFASSIPRDIDDEPRVIGGRVEIGCDEMLATNLYGPLSAALVATRTNTTVGFALSFQADVRGKVLGLVWNMQMPGGPPAQVFNQADLSWAWPQTGVYEVVLQAYNDSMSAAATVTVSVIEAFTNYVSKSGGAIWPYDSWDNAATCILDAVEAAVPGNLILVANGTYYERAEVLLDIPVTLRSVNPLGATIHGEWQRRCARIDHPDAVIDGFYLFRGNPTNSPGGESGGVVLNGGGTVMNCTIQDNRSPTYGAGALLYGGGLVTNCQLLNNGGVGGVSYGAGAALFNGGKVVDCLLRWNEASQRGGAVICYFDGLVQRCRIYNNRCGGEGGGVAFHEGGQVVECDIAVNEANEGGGAHYYQGGTIERCAISNNLGYSQGGGVKFYAGGLLRNSLVWRNDAPWGGYGGGGVMIRYAGTVESCTIASNSAATSGNGGLYCNPGGTVRNSIIYHNVGNNVTAPEQGSFTHCCAPIALAGAGNITNDPLFINVAAGNCRLDYLTPCLNAGDNQPWMSSATDLDGQPRIISGTVDMGCYETSYGTQAPFLDITETNTAIPYFLTTITIGGTNNNHVIGSMWISNATVGGAAVPFTPARQWRSAAIGVAYGTNTLVVYGSNFASTVVSDTIDVTRAYPGADAPFVWITTMPQTVSYDLNSMTIAGTNNVNVVGGMWLSNAANGAVVEMPAQLSWSAVIALDVGDNQITAYGTNAAGVLAYSQVTITRGGIGTGAPFVDITNTSPRVVSYGASTATIGGTNNAHVIGVIRWVNTTAGTSGSATRAGNAWSALITGLLHGDNTVQVIGTNLLAQQSMDTITVHRKTAAESLPQIASNVLIFPSHAAVLQAPLPTNVIWLVTGITDDDDGTNVTISAMTVHVSNTLEQVAVVTNNISNVNGWCPWVVPQGLIGVGTTYVMRFEVVDSNGLTNSMIFNGNGFTVVPEAALGLLLLIGVGMLCARR